MRETAMNGTAKKFEKICASIKSSHDGVVQLYQNLVDSAVEKRQAEIEEERQLGAKLKEMKMEQENSEIELRATGDTLEELQETLENLNPELEFRLVEKEKLEILLKALETLVSEEQSCVDKETAKFTSAKKRFETESLLFIQNFGLEVQKLSEGNWKQFGFRYLSGASTEVEAKLNLRCTKGIFEVDQVQPAVANVGALLDTLNQSGDLRSFLIAMRSEFQKVLG